MKKLTILEKLKPSSFRDKEEDKIVIEGAIFLTYSIDCKTILSSLISMFAEEVQGKVEDEAVTQNNSVEKGKDIVKCWQRLLRHGMATEKSNTSEDVFRELQEHVAFVCNDGYDKSIASPIYWYTRELTYYYKWTEAEGKYSFHPKLYLVKYRKNGELYFRFMIGSMNFVNSKNKEFMVIFDVRAYEEQPAGENYVHCNVLKELLNLDEDDSSPNIKNGQPTKLGKVIENLGLDKYYFLKSTMERIITFPQGTQDILASFHKEKQLETQSNIILSPFLSKDMVNGLKNTKLFTMESELKKCGYVPVEEGEEVDETTGDIKVFYVYSPKEGENAFTHIKMYVSEEGIYVGSANFTQSALGEQKLLEKADKEKASDSQEKVKKQFGKNKELLVKLDVDESGFRDELANYLKVKETDNNDYNYIEKKFRYDKKVEEEQKNNINDIFRGIVEKIVYSLQQQIVSDENGYGYKSIVSIKVNKKEQLELTEETRKKLKEGLALSDKETFDIKIAPFCSKDKAKSLLHGKAWEWQVNNRLKLDDAFLFTLYKGDKAVVSLKYHIDTKQKENMVSGEEKTDLRKSVMLCYLGQLLENRGVTSSTITKDAGDVESGTLRKDTIGYVRRAMPSLETILRNGLSKKELSVERIEQQVQHLEQWKVLLDNEENLLEGEKKLLGIDGTSKKIINNLLEQGKLLLEELQK